MFKRKADNEGDAPEKKVAPIPRHLGNQSVTLHFKNTTWESVARGELKYIPIHQNPFYMFDKAMIEQFNQFKELWCTMEIHGIKYKMSNFMMLQDDYKVTGGTPVDTSTYNQACYMLEHQPTRQTEYFALCNVDNDDELSGQFLTYDLAPKNKSQLISIKGYTDFTHLGVIPAQINKEAGYLPSTIPNTTPTGDIKDAYIAPTIRDFGQCSGNLSVSTNPEDKNFVSFGNSITYARNLDKTIPIKYGDVVEHTVNTNLNGVKLAKHPNNDFTDRTNYLYVNDSTTGLTFRYTKEFAYPSPNRPFLTRGSNYNAITAEQHPKGLNNLTHKFLTMPPILKNTGALLGQRCNFMMESEMAVTFNFIESIFDGDEAENFLSQKDAVILRPNIYGKMTTGLVPTNAEGGLCSPVKSELDCKNVASSKAPIKKPITCPLNNFNTLNEFLGTLSTEHFNDIVKAQTVFPGGTETSALTVKESFSALTWDTPDKNFFKQWNKALVSEVDIIISVVGPKKIGDEYHVCIFGNEFAYNEIIYKEEVPGQYIYLIFDMIKFNKYKEEYGYVCVDKKEELKRSKYNR